MFKMINMALNENENIRETAEIRLAMTGTPLPEAKVIVYEMGDREVVVLAETLKKEGDKKLNKV